MYSQLVVISLHVFDDDWPQLLSHCSKDVAHLWSNADMTKYQMKKV